MKERGITQVPMAYHGGVDTDASGSISEKNIKQFTKWTEEFLPEDYCGPVVIDYEQPWWNELRAKTIHPERLREILSIYIEGVRIARGLRSTAGWGYWGFPATRNTSSDWLEQGHSTESLIKQCRALYPEVYDCSRSVNRTVQVQNHITTVLSQAAGRIPVYVFVSPRYCGENKDRSFFIPDDDFIRQVNAAMRATWMDHNNQEHRIKGLILWDAYGYTPESDWVSLDLKHRHYLELLVALVNAWDKEMSGVEVITEPLYSENCQEGLAEPTNSSEAIYDKSKTMKESDSVQSDKVKDNRVPSRRLPNEEVPR